MSSLVPIAIHGAAGRMGQAIVRLAGLDAGVEIVAAIVRPNSPMAGARVTDASEVRFRSDIASSTSPRVLLDFSVADAFDAALALARERRIAFVSGTTGLSARQDAALRDAAATIPVLWSANFSIGVAVLERLVREAARALSDWDCEIAEAHHRHKKDSPSGTALALGRAVADARGVDFERVAQRERAGAREDSTIGFASVRAGDIVGEHTVLFAGEGERVELTHRASDRTIFARGALRAAAWIADRPPGRFTLADVIGAEAMGRSRS
jgi:4-hydroxy-tetrahydrodipicolinate reductase